VRRALLAFVVLISACDVAVSLGDHDAGTDGGLRDATPMLDAGHDAAARQDGGAIDAGSLLDANDLDAGVPDAHVPDAHVQDAGTDAAPADVGVDGHVTCTTPDAGACVQCQAAMCCTEYLACTAAATCPCIVDCVLAGGHTVSECSVHCGADHGESTPLITCAQHHCACP
jgi:hypothetical protein